MSFSFSVIFSLFSALVICDVYDNFSSSVCASCSLLTHWGDTNSLDHITGDIFAIWFASISNNREKESADYFWGEMRYVASIFILNEGGRKNMTTRKMLEPCCPHFLKLGWLFTFFIGHLVSVIITNQNENNQDGMPAQLGHGGSPQPRTWQLLQRLYSPQWGGLMFISITMTRCPNVHNEVSLCS